MTTVESKEFTNVTIGKKEYGITIEIALLGTRLTTKHTSYIDYDELATLIKGIDYITKVTGSSTKMDNFQADLTTRGDLRISSFSTEDKAINIAVSSGTIGKATAYYDLNGFNKVRDLIIKAKAKIDEIKQQ